MLFSLFKVFWLPSSCPPMRRWQRSPPPLLHPTAPSSPCREVHLGVRAPLTPITTSTVTPALPISALLLVPAPRLPPRALTTPAVPASHAPSPPQLAPPSLSSWQTRCTITAICPHPARRSPTVLLCQGSGPPSRLLLPPRRRYKFHQMSYPQSHRMSCPCKGGPLMAVTESRLWLCPSPCRCNHAPHAFLAFRSLPSLCCLPFLPVKLTLTSCQTRSVPRPVTRRWKGKSHLVVQPPGPHCQHQNRPSSPRMWLFLRIATANKNRNKSKKRRKRKKMMMKRIISGTDGSRATRASRYAAVTWRKRSRRKRNCRRLKEGRWRRQREQTYCTTAWTVPSELLSHLSWMTAASSAGASPCPPTSSRRRSRPSSPWSPHKMMIKSETVE